MEPESPNRINHLEQTRDFVQGSEIVLSGTPIRPDSVHPGVFSTFVATVFDEGTSRRIFAPFLGLHLERLAQNSFALGLGCPSSAEPPPQENSAAAPSPMSCRRLSIAADQKLILSYLERGALQASSLGELVAGDRLICRLIQTGRLDQTQLIVSVDRYKPRWTGTTPIMLHAVHKERIQPEIKSTDLKIAMASAEAARAAGCDEALLIDRNGHVREGSYSNLFWIDSDGTAWTPRSNVLPGIVRRVLIESGAARLSDAEISLPELLKKSEIFITQSTTGITPVGQIDGQLICSGTCGPHTARISEHYSIMLAAEKEGRSSSGPDQQNQLDQPRSK